MANRILGETGSALVEVLHVRPLLRDWSTGNHLLRELHPSEEMS